MAEKPTVSQVACSKKGKKGCMMPDVTLSEKGNGVAVVFDDMTEFFVLRNALDEMLRQKIAVDIVVPSEGSYSQELLDNTFNAIKDFGYKPIRSEEAKKNKYKIFFEPYPTDNYFGGALPKHVFRIQYNYGLGVGNKPDPCYTPEWHLPYDAEFTYNARNTAVEGVYTRTHLVGCPGYYGFKKQKHDGKPNLLYAPTFGAGNSVKATRGILVRLRKKYNIIVRLHHAIQYRPDAQEDLKILRESVDEIYDSETSIIDVWKKTDIALTDNSGSIFEAIYTKTPIVILSENPNAHKLDSINTYQHELICDGIIPWTDDPAKVLDLLRTADRYYDKQQVVRDQYITDPKRLKNDFVDMTKQYLAMEKTQEVSFAAHDILRDGWYKMRRQNEAYQRQNEAYQEQNNFLKQEIVQIRCGYETSTSWKITKPFRAINYFLSARKGSARNEGNNENK
jgi:hypothetical protein